MSVPPAPTRGNPAVRRPGRPRSLSAHQAILDAALDLLAAEGYERMTIEAVAARAGVGKTTIYRRWASKEDLIIDAMENLGNDPNVVETHAHGPNLDFGGPHTLAVPATGWHTYALDWSASQVSWSIDGTVVQTMTKAQAGSGWVFDHPFFVILNLAVGGDWPGAPDASTVFPARVLVDDVRVTN